MRGSFTEFTGWAQLARHSSRKNTGLRKGDTVATVIRFFQLPVWTVNPCRVTNIISEDFHKNGKSTIQYATLKGHLLCGDETLELQFARNCVTNMMEITFNMQSRAMGSNRLMKCFHPIIDCLRDRFLQAHVDAFSHQCNY